MRDREEGFWRHGGGGGCECTGVDTKRHFRGVFLALCDKERSGAQ